MPVLILMITAIVAAVIIAIVLLRTNRTLVIGLDGLDSQTMYEEMADLLNGRKVTQLRFTLPHYSVSGSGWATILTGLPMVEHCVASNNPELMAGMVDEDFCTNAINRGLQTHIIYGWPGIATLLSNSNKLGPSNMRAGSWDDLDQVLAQPGKRRLVFFHSDEPDTIGHNVGFGTEYSAECRKQLTLALAVMDRLKGWKVIITTDHGRAGREHNTSTVRELTTWMITNFDAKITTPQEIASLTGMRTKQQTVLLPRPDQITTGVTTGIDREFYATTQHRLMLGPFDPPPNSVTIKPAVRNPPLVQTNSQQLWRYEYGELTVDGRVARIQPWRIASAKFMPQVMWYCLVARVDNASFETTTLPVTILVD